MAFDQLAALFGGLLADNDIHTLREHKQVMNQREGIIEKI